MRVVGKNRDVQIRLCKLPLGLNLLRATIACMTPNARLPQLEERYGSFPRDLLPSGPYKSTLQRFDQIKSYAYSVNRVKPKCHRFVVHSRVVRQLQTAEQDIGAV